MKSFLKKFGKKLSNNNNRSRVAGGIRGRRRRNKLYSFARNVYSLSTAPQTYGPGFKLVNLEYFDEASNNSFLNLNTVFSTSAEHQLYKTMFNFFKIINFVIIFPSQQSQVGANYLIFQVNWNNSDVNGLLVEENCKWVPIYRTRDLVYKFVPPDLPLLLGTNLNPVVINLRNYMRTTDDILIPGCINFKTNNAITSSLAIYRVVFRVEYRGAKLPDSEALHKFISLRDENSANSEKLRKIVEGEEKGEELESFAEADSQVEEPLQKEEKEEKMEIEEEEKKEEDKKENEEKDKEEKEKKEEEKDREEKEEKK